MNPQEKTTATTEFRKREGAYFKYFITFRKEFKGRTCIDGYCHATFEEQRKWKQNNITDRVRQMRQVLERILKEKPTELETKYGYPIKTYEVWVVNRSADRGDCHIATLVYDGFGGYTTEGEGGYICYDRYKNDRDLDMYREWVQLAFNPKKLVNDWSVAQYSKTREKMTAIMGYFFAQTREEFGKRIQCLYDNVMQKIYKEDTSSPEDDARNMVVAKRALVQKAEDMLTHERFWQMQKEVNNPLYIRELSIIAFVEFLFDNLVPQTE